MRATGSAAVPMIEEFSRYVLSSTIDDLQEIYTRTFEFNPAVWVDYFFSVHNWIHANPLAEESARPLN